MIISSMGYQFIICGQLASRPLTGINKRTKKRQRQILGFFGIAPMASLRRDLWNLSVMNGHAIPMILPIMSPARSMER